MFFQQLIAGMKWCSRQRAANKLKLINRFQRTPEEEAEHDQHTQLWYRWSFPACMSNLGGLDPPWTLYAEHTHQVLWPFLLHTGGKAWPGPRSCQGRIHRVFRQLSDSETGSTQMVHRSAYECGEENNQKLSQLPTSESCFCSCTMGNSWTLDRLIQALMQSQLSLTFKIRLKRTRKQEASPAVAFHPLLADRWSPKRRKPVPENQNKCTISMQIYPNLSPAKGLAPVWIWMSLWQLKQESGGRRRQW